MLELIKEIDRTVDNQWVYKPDGPKDVWQSFATSITNGLTVYGDCDDKASTALQLAVEAGVPLDRLVRVVAATEDIPNHFLGAYEDDEGHWWTLGDTITRTTRFDYMNYTVYKYSRLNEGNIWRKPVR